jgi:hypothetical protein
LRHAAWLLSLGVNLKVANNLDIKVGVWRQHTLIRSDDVSFGLCSFYLVQDLVLASIINLNKTEWFIFNALLENNSLSWIKNDLFLPWFSHC